MALATFVVVAKFSTRISCNIWRLSPSLKYQINKTDLVSHSREGGLAKASTFSLPAPPFSLILGNCWAALRLVSVVLSCAQPVSGVWVIRNATYSPYTGFCCSKNPRLGGIIVSAKDSATLLHSNLPKQMRFTVHLSHVATLREILLVACLVTALIVISGLEYLRPRDPYSHNNRIGFGQNSEDQSFDTTYPEPLFSWKENEVPETKIVRHANGMLYGFSTSVYTHSAS